MSVVSDERLRQISRMSGDDFEDIAVAVRELAVAILERFPEAAPPAPQPTPAPAKRPQRPGKGEPLGDRVPADCGRCSKPVVIFMSKKGKPYACDVVVSDDSGVRQTLTSNRWFHECGGRRG